MIKVLGKNQAKKIWDSSILMLSNSTYYQSYNYSEICKGDCEIEYIYKTDLNNDIIIMGFVKIDEDKVSIPFGPIFKSDCELIEILNFISEIKSYYKKNVVFSLPSEIVDADIIRDFNLTKGWYFATPLVDTDKSIEEIVQSCNENRRRIIRKVLQNIPQENIITDSKYAEEFLRLYERRMKEVNGEVDLSPKALYKMLEYDNTKLTVCLDGNQVIAGSVTFEFGDTLITRYNCYDSDYFKISPIARVDYELLKYASLNPNIKYYDMSGLAEGEQISDKEMNLNRYKLSYRPSKVLTYQWYKHN